MYFFEQFSPIAENIMTGGKEKLKLVLRMYTIQVPITETIQRGGSRFRSAPMSRHCGTPFDVFRIFIKNNLPSSRKQNDFKLPQKNPCSAVVINKAWHTSIILSSVS